MQMFNFLHEVLLSGSKVVKSKTIKLTISVAEGSIYATSYTTVQKISTLVQIFDSQKW